MSDFDHLSDDVLKELGLVRQNPDGSDPLGRVALCCEDDENKKLTERLDMAEGLLRRASDSTRSLTNGEEGWEWECHPIYIIPDEAEYLRSLDGEGDHA